MVERDGWKPHNKEAAFNAGSQGGNTSGGEARPPDRGGGSEEMGESLSTDIQKRLAESRKIFHADSPEQPHTENDLSAGGFVFVGLPLPPDMVERLERKRERENERREARNEQRRKRYRQRRLQGKHGGGDQSPGPNNPSSAK